MKISNNHGVAPVQTRQPAFKRNWQEHVSWGARYVKETGKANFKLFTFPDAKMVFVEVAQKAGKSFGSIKERIVQLLAAQGAAFAITDAMGKDEDTKVYRMDNKGNGVFETQDIDVEENAQYRYVIVKDHKDVRLVKDPYAMKQPDINGWSEIYNPDNYEWKATDWLEGNDPRRITRKPNEELRGLENLVIEEINIPTLSEEGTFEKAMSHIDKVAERGIATAIEIMPVENTFSLQWGYDGVDKFAVNEKMGSAAQLKELIDYAHSKGLNVIMDMVPNHIGPDGNYLPQTGPYVKHAGDFGDIPNFEGENNRYVRDWMANAALWWVNEFKVDGLRLDMTKYCDSDYLLKQIIAEVNEHNPEIFMIAEDGRENKHTVTDYNKYEISHEDELEMIDQSVDNIANKRWHTYPEAIGFDSEWDFPLMHELKDSIIYPDKINLDRLDSRIWNSRHRMKFVMSHDEIGNEDGTRLIPKVVASEMGLFFKTKGYNDAEKGQNAANLAQKLTEMYVTEDIFNLSLEDLHRRAKDAGLANNRHVYSQNIEKAFKIAFAKQKMAMACIMTLPGPKMYFQGDDSLALSRFKFFREFSNYEANPHSIDDENRKKGYNTLERHARPDSIIDSVQPTQNDYEQKMMDFSQDLSNIFKENEVLQKGQLINTYKDPHHQVHVHRLKLDEDEVLVFKNFGSNFHSDSYGIANFPEGNWVEIFNSDNEIYGGSNYINEHRGDGIYAGNQNLNLAPNSVLILKKV